MSNWREAAINAIALALKDLPPEADKKKAKAFGKEASFPKRFAQLTRLTHLLSADITPIKSGWTSAGRLFSGLDCGNRQVIGVVSITATSRPVYFVRTNTKNASNYNLNS